MSRQNAKDLSHQFRPLLVYRTRAGDRYSLLPFRFLTLDAERYLVSNFAGEHLVLPKETVRALIQHRLPLHSDAYHRLKSRHFLLDGDSTVPIELLAAKYRTKQTFLGQFTSLFMFVTTLRCDHSCTYCQVSQQPQTAVGYDMSKEVADRAVDFMFRSPSRTMKVEFQGGESLLNFEIVKYIVCTVEERNRSEGRAIEFVLTTNLSSLDEAALHFCFDHELFVSTSLDGPRDLHNVNRPRSGGDSYEEAFQGIRRVQEVLGPHRVSALMTTTRVSLSQAREIVDEYVRCGFSSIFLRAINPYGRAASAVAADQYSMEEWLKFYRTALGYILELNRQGLSFREDFAALLLRRMLTPFATGYVDLQSPAGIGISGIIFNYNGDVYASDESRMLGEMGDHTFRMGSLLRDSYRDIMLSEALLGPLEETMTECVPQCADCGIQPYCGSDPVRHYRTQGDTVGFKPGSDFCKKHMGVATHLVRLLEDDREAAMVLRTWI